MNDDFDPLDHTLARELRGLAPSEFELDADRTLGSMRPALQRARARRRLAVTSSALGVFAVVVVGAAALRHETTSKLNIQGRSHPTVSTAVRPSTPKPSTTTRPVVVVPPITTPRDVPSTTRPDRQPSGSGPTPTITAPAITTPATTKTTTPSSRGETTTTIAPASTKTYSAVGGHATIRFAAGRLTLVSYAPSAGYQNDLRKNTATEIEIRFSNGNLESRIRVRVQDGQVRPEITEK